MKKLIIALATVAFATIVEAATCNWTATQITYATTSGTPSSYAAYLIDASVVGRTTMIDALTAGDTSLLTGAAIVRTATPVAQGTDYMRISSTGFGDYTAGDTYSYYTIVLDNTVPASAAYFLATAEKANVEVPSSGSMNMAFGSQASNAWQAIPEPTSGLLLLVGGALLALKRKRA